MQSMLDTSCRQHQQLIGCYSSNKKQMALMEQSKSPAVIHNSSGKKNPRHDTRREFLSNEHLSHVLLNISQQQQTDNYNNPPFSESVHP